MKDTRHRFGYQLSAVSLQHSSTEAESRQLIAESHYYFMFRAIFNAIDSEFVYLCSNTKTIIPWTMKSKECTPVQ